MRVQRWSVKPDPSRRDPYAKDCKPEPQCSGEYRETTGSPQSSTRRDYALFGFRGTRRIKGGALVSISRVQCGIVEGVVARGGGARRMKSVVRRGRGKHKRWSGSLRILMDQKEKREGGGEEKRKTSEDRGGGGGGKKKRMTGVKQRAGSWRSGRERR